MPVARTRSVLSGMRVKEAMRRQIVVADRAEPAAAGIARMIKYKADILLVNDGDGRPAGLVSKTDMTGAFYAGLPVETPLGDIMMGPLVCCYPDDRLEDALQTMTDGGMHQLFVKGADDGRLEGLLAFADILGLVYRYCRRCRRSRARDDAAADAGAIVEETRVGEVMTASVIACRDTDDLTGVMETLTSQRKSALLVKGARNHPVGVISKSDLVLAWHRGIDGAASAASIMSAPVRSCPRQSSLTEAMARMLLQDIGRIFVHDPDPQSIVGVMSLTDAASHRSGTCRACVSSRMLG